MREIQLKDLSEQYQRLLLEAEVVRETAYAPHSKFLVGAAVLSSDGEIYGGSNVENCAWMVVCAERSAICHANAHGKRYLKAVAIIARGLEFDTEEVTGPCGPCRQMLYEAADVADGDIDVILANTSKSKIILSSIRELMPLGFGPASIKADLSKFQPKVK